MTPDEWYRYVPEDEHSSDHKYCDPTKCSALLRRAEKVR